MSDRDFENLHDEFQRILIRIFSADRTVFHISLMVCNFLTLRRRAFRRKILMGYQTSQRLFLIRPLRC